MSFRMLVLDLDGTAVRADGSLDPRDLAAVRALRELDVVITVATGRIFSGTVVVARELGVEGAVACANGSELVDVATGEVRSGFYVAPEDRAIVRDAFEHHGLHAALLTTHEVHHAHRAVEHEPLLRMWSHRLVSHEGVIDGEVWTRTTEIAAIVGLDDADAGEPAVLALRKSRPALETILVRNYDGFRSFVKVRRAEVDKGTALTSLAEAHGIGAEETIAVGDWYNDIPMLRAAGRSFVVDGAPDDVREHADETLAARKGAGGAVADVAQRVWGIRV